MLTKLRASLPLTWVRAGALSEWFASPDATQAAGADAAYAEWAGAKAKPRRSWKKIVLLSLTAALVIAALVAEMRTSWLQARVITGMLEGASYKVQRGEVGEAYSTGNGPYDERLGYIRLTSVIDRLKRVGYEVEAQAKWSEKLLRFRGFGMFPVYQEKTQAGLRVLDRHGNPLHASIFPSSAYPTFDSIPPLVIGSALYIENREILDSWAPRRNPAIEWDRLAKAVVDLGVRQVNHAHSISGGSTLATQLEKIRHSPGGRTESVREKARQIATASLRAYREGPQTLAARRVIVKDYLNSVPLAATAAHGEVIGLADGLKDWFGADFQSVNAALKADERGLTEAEWKARALAYRQVLSLLLAINRPTYYLRHHPLELKERADAYLRVMVAEGLISPELRDRALLTAAPLQPSGETRVRSMELDRKGTDAVRYTLLGLLGVDSLYELDRLDLTVETTLHERASKFAAQTMDKLQDPDFLTASGLVGERMLFAGQGSPVIYSLTLYERGAAHNRLLLQLDNSGQALNLNEGSKLELGSTAKLRTLTTYLELVAELREQLVEGRNSKRIPMDDPDRLTRWAADYLRRGGDSSLPAMLDAAMERSYSASPGEAFFTGGGLHQFANFDGKDNGRVLTVREAFRRSVNLVFIRLMRDIVDYQVRRLPGYSPGLLSDDNHPAREKYLARFADREGSVFLRAFYERYAGLAPDEAVEILLSQRELTASRFSVLYRSVRPNATLGDFHLAMLGHVRENVSEKRINDLYEMYGADKLDWNDRGYVAGIHPLELWLVAYMQGNPQASWDTVRKASAQLRQDVYGWLFKSRSKHGQDIRIRSVLEADAFAVLLPYWKRQGFPFRMLVPSLATAIGSSGDTPAALADLSGVILNGGIRQPAIRVERLHFAQGTPFETRMARKLEQPVRVLAPEVAQRLHKEMLGVVEFGTARRAFQSVTTPSGQILSVAGKTGTGDNRIKSFYATGKARSRTAAFVFSIGDRYFGSLIAYVPGEQADAYKFSSALPVQIFKMIVPGAVKLVEQDRRTEPPKSIAASLPGPVAGSPAAASVSLSR
ncbi:MAG TPA: transglycosylase domain-containing protein [Bryobacteraceae bacterium]|nr:transglycosylase domain-containing protein [Bryobacteraceae bacterium]